VAHTTDTREDFLSPKMGYPTQTCLCGILTGLRGTGPFRREDRVHRDRTFLAEGVEAEAAPAPLLRALHQSARDRIAMHVAQFLDALLLGPNVEVVEARLPEALGDGVWEKSHLQIFPTPLPLYPPRDALLQCLDHGRKIIALGFADEKMNVLGHDDVADHGELIVAGGLFKSAEEHVAPRRLGEELPASVATERDEVQVVGTVVAFEAAWHEGRDSTPNSHTNKFVWGTPLSDSWICSGR
jgi:hypothetical protein